MKSINSIDTPKEAVMLVGFSDLTGFGRYSNGKTDQEIFQFMSEYAEYTGEVIEKAGGRIVKFIGDAFLFAFPGEKADAGVKALLELKTSGDAWLKQRGLSMRHVIKAHIGPVYCGGFGTKTNKRFDVFGETVNIAALTESKGLAITPQTFRSLSDETRKLLKKHTPPVTYIPTDESHS